MVQGYYVIAQAFGKLEGALELGSGRAWRPGDVEVVEHGGGGRGVPYRGVARWPELGQSVFCKHKIECSLIECSLAQWGLLVLQILT